jgi:hypothetical protein
LARFVFSLACPSSLFSLSFPFSCGHGAHHCRPVMASPFYDAWVWILTLVFWEKGVPWVRFRRGGLWKERLVLNGVFSLAGLDRQARQEPLRLN